MIDGLLLGIGTAFTATNLLFVAGGCLIGMLIGMLPGLGPISAIALMIPISYNLPPATGMILLAGVYYGAIFGGSTSAILINAPGVAGTVATSFDGYPLAQSGKAGTALAVAAYASFLGGTLGVVFLMLLAPALAGVALSFQSPEYTLIRRCSVLTREQTQTARPKTSPRISGGTSRRRRGTRTTDSSRRDTCGGDDDRQ